MKTTDAIYDLLNSQLAHLATKADGYQYIGNNLTEINQKLSKTRDAKKQYENDKILLDKIVESLERRKRSGNSGPTSNKIEAQLRKHAGNLRILDNKIAEIHREIMELESGRDKLLEKSQEYLAIWRRICFHASQYLDPIIGVPRSQKAHFIHIERTLESLLRRIRFIEMTESGDDDNYVGALNKDFRAATERVRAADALFEKLGNRINENFASGSKFLLIAKDLETLSNTIDIAQEAHDQKNCLADLATLKAISPYLSNFDGIRILLNHLNDIFSSSNLKEGVIDGLQPARRQAQRVAGFVGRIQRPAIVALLFASLSLPATHAMSITPWWEPFQWLPIIMIAVIFGLSVIVFSMIDMTCADNVRRQFARVLVGAAPNSSGGDKWLQHNAKLIEKSFWAFDQLGKKNFKPLSVYEAAFSKLTSGEEPQIQHRTSNYFSEQPEDELPTRQEPLPPETGRAPSVIGKTKRLIARILSAMGNGRRYWKSDATIVAALALGAFLMFAALMDIVAGKCCKFPPNLALSVFDPLSYFEQPMALRDRKIVSIVVGSDSIGGECRLACGNIFWSGRNQIHVRPIVDDICGVNADLAPSPDGTSAPSSAGNLIVIPREQVRRVINWDGGALPSNDRELGWCRRINFESKIPITLETDIQMTSDNVDLLPPIVLLMNNTSPQIQNFPASNWQNFYPVYVLDHSTTQLIKRPHIPFLDFATPAGLNVSNDKELDILAIRNFVSTTPDNKKVLGDVEKMSRFLGGCASSSSIELDIMGFASDLPFKFGALSSNEANIELAEARRKAVIKILASEPTLLHGNVAIRVDDKQAVILAPSIDVDRLPNRFGDSVGDEAQDSAALDRMEAERSTWIRSLSSSNDNSPFARAVIIEIKNGKFGACSPGGSISGGQGQ